MWIVSVTVYHFEKLGMPCETGFPVYQNQGVLYKILSDPLQHIAQSVLEGLSSQGLEDDCWGCSHRNG